MSDYHVPRGATVRLDRISGELTIGSRARIEASSGNLVVVSGMARFEGAAEVECDFECESLVVSSGGVLKVHGNLVVHNLIDVDHTIDVDGEISAGDIEVGGTISSNSLKCRRMRVGGKIEVEDKLEVESLRVGGKVEAPGTVAIRDFDVGGQADIGGGKITGNIRVGGKFESNSQLEFGDLQVYGRTELAGGSKGTKISTSGHLIVSGNFDCDTIEVLGKSEVGGDCTSKEVKVNGGFEVEGSLQALESLEVYGSVKIERDIFGHTLRVGGKLEAEKVVVSNEIDVAGMIETRRGLKGETIKVGSGSRIEGAIVGRSVDIGKSYGAILDWEKSFMGQLAALRLVGRMTKVEDIYADHVRLGNASRCGKVFARVVELGDGSIADEISYTGELKGNLAKVHVEKAPMKVRELPAPPL